MKCRFLASLSVLGLLVASNPVMSCDELGITGIVEENNLWIGPENKGPQTITEEEFNQVIDEIEAIYAPIIAEKGKELVVERKWEDGTVNAYARQVGNKWMVSMFGGLARHETITKDAFAMVLCHELGHHLGGAPKKGGWFGGLTWASNEGQSDYWGASKCMRRYMEKHDNTVIVSNMDVDALATSTCEKQFSGAQDIAICQRSSMAGLSLGNLFRALRRQDTELSFSTPDPKVVSRTDHSHPASQCRLDTYFAGSICDVHYSVDVDNRDAKVGTCNRADGFEIGNRPLCWYKP